MGRCASKEVLEQKIEKIEKAISKNRSQYDELTVELEDLHEKQKAIRSREILDAIENSPRSYDEIYTPKQGWLHIYYDGNFLNRIG